MKMDEPNNTNRRTVLKTLGAGIAGGTGLVGTAGAHGSDDWGTPAWLLTDVWEMADREPSGEDPTDHNSHVPIYYIAPAAADKSCAQVTKDFSEWESLSTFEDDMWSSVRVDQTLHDIPPPEVEFTTLWHEHFVFDGKPSGANGGYVPDDLVNEDTNGDPLIDSGRRILADDSLDLISVPLVFNCPARPAQGDHQNYC